MAKFHGRNVRVYVDGYDISGYTNQISVDQTADIVDVAAFSSTVKEYVVGLFDSAVEHSGFFEDTPVSGGHAVLGQRIGSSTHAMILVGTAPGGYGFAGSAEIETMYSIEASIQGAVTWKSKLANFGTQGVDPTITVSAKRIAAAGTIASVDTGAFSNNGGRIYLQNFGSFGHGTPENSGGTVFVSFGNDANLAAGSLQLGTFAPLGATPFGSGISFSGTFPRYISLRTTGTPQFAVQVSRG